MATDLTGQDFNGGTQDVVCTSGTLSASDRKGVARPNGAYKVCVLPAGAILLRTFIVTEVAFNGATATVSVGDGTTAGKWVAALTSVKAAGIVTGSLALLAAPVAYPQDIVVTTVLAGSVTGRIKVVFEYLDLAANRQIFTA